MGERDPRGRPGAPVSDDEASVEPPTLPRDDRAPQRRASHPPPVPRALPDRYEPRESLGAGAMGEVLLCHDRRIGRDVAMKLTRREFAGDARVRLRFEREARVQGQLEHPAIVPVHDLGGDAGGVFFTMKRIQGRSLREVLTALRDGDPELADRFHRRRLLGAFSTICLAVAFAHARGVIHRDIKPSNIMLGDFGEVYLLDWGVARVRDAGEMPADVTLEAHGVEVPSDFLGVTTAGDVMGTVGYMAPEQVRGDAIDERADVYALGATLFEILTVQPLLPRAPAADAVRATLDGVDARASVRAPEAAVPIELEELCVRATALDPNDRPPSARALHEAIERFLDGDRDVERRRALAQQHAARARADRLHALVGGAGSREARERAFREANRALALDPENADAIDVLRALVVHASPELTGETGEALRASIDTARRIVARVGAALAATWLGTVAFAFVLGVRSGWSVFALAVLVLAAAAMAAARARRDDEWLAWGALVAADAAAALTSGAFGPFVVVPTLLACNTVAFTIASKPWEGSPLDRPGEGRMRVAAVALGLAAFLAPLALEAAGVVPSSIAFDAGRIVLLPRAVDFPPGATLTLLVVGNALLVVVPMLIAVRIRDYADDVERRAFEATARLRQLLPREARDAAHGPMAISRQAERASLHGG